MKLLSFFLLKVYAPSLVPRPFPASSGRPGNEYSILQAFNKLEVGKAWERGNTHLFVVKYTEFYCKVYCKVRLIYGKNTCSYVKQESIEKVVK